MCLPAEKNVVVLKGFHDSYVINFFFLLNCMVIGRKQFQGREEKMWAFEYKQLLTDLWEMCISGQNCLQVCLYVWVFVQFRCYPSGSIKDIQDKKVKEMEASSSVSQLYTPIKRVLMFL